MQLLFPANLEDDKNPLLAALLVSELTTVGVRREGVVGSSGASRSLTLSASHLLPGRFQKVTLMKAPRVKQQPNDAKTMN